MIGSIYKVQNLLNQKCYIGFTSQGEVRWSDHCNRARVKARKHHSHFHRALIKYGIENFQFEIIYMSRDVEHCKNVMEGYFIQKYNSFDEGYNRTRGGEGTIGRKCTQAARDRMSAAQKGLKLGVKLTQEHRNKIGDAVRGERNGFYGKKHSKEFKSQKSQSMMGERHRYYGKSFSEEHRRKISEAHLGKRFSDESKLKMAKAKSKIYEIVHPTGQIEIIKNMSTFCREHNLNHGRMFQVAKGKENHHKKFLCSQITDSINTNVYVVE